jgi:hypothetical protein
VIFLIRKEWDMQRQSDDENTQKCLIKEIATEATYTAESIKSKKGTTRC